MRYMIIVFLLYLCFTSGVFAISSVNETGVASDKAGIRAEVYNMGIVPPTATLAPSKIDQGVDQIGRYIVYPGSQAGASVVATGGNLSLPILIDTKTGRSWQYSLTWKQEVCWLEINRYTIIPQVSNNLMEIR